MTPRLTLATQWPRADKGGLAAIEDWIQQHEQARLVIIDTWPKFRRSRVTGKMSIRWITRTPPK